MSVESRIKNALEPLGYKVYPDNYNGADKTYFVFNINTNPDDFGDNEPQHEKALIQVHLYCPHTLNSVTLRTNVKKYLSAAGFTYPRRTGAGDADGQHHVFECECVEGIDG
jgi:hypothetical protein